MFEEPFFTPDFSGITYEFPIFSDYAMAREENRQGISIVCESNGSGCFGISDAVCDFTVGCSSPAG